MTKRGYTETIEIAGRKVQATWIGVDEIVPGVTMVVCGPSIGEFWKDENSVVSVRAVEVVGDRTNTRVVMSCDDEANEDSGAWGNWSRMTFMSVPSNEIPC